MYDYQADKFTLYQSGSERRHNETKHKKNNKKNSVYRIRDL